MQRQHETHMLFQGSKCLDRNAHSIDYCPEIFPHLSPINQPVRRQTQVTHAAHATNPHDAGRRSPRQKDLASKRMKPPCQARRTAKPATKAQNMSWTEQREYCGETDGHGDSEWCPLLRQARFSSRLTQTCSHIRSLSPDTPKRSTTVCYGIG